MGFQFARFSELPYGMNSTKGADFNGLISEWQKLTELAGQMFRQPITVDTDLLNGINMSSFSTLFRNIVNQDMTGM
jgi:hypothetical protein